MATAITKIGKYQVLGPLGKGANSTILHVRRSADSREYALKIVSVNGPEDQKYLTQAKHEFRVAQMLGHVNLCKIYALELERDWLFRTKKANVLVEYINGKTLDLVPIPQDQLVVVFAQIAAGLAHMHRRGVFHGDLKPNNIMWGKRGEVKVIDYGLASIKGEPKDRVQGTPEYMAPETARSRVVNEKTDLYNFGATMYRLTTHKLPPNAMGATESVRLNASTHKSLLVPVSELNKGAPKALCDLIHQCLEYSPEKRPERANEVFDELKALAKSLGTPLSDEE